tara:strand:- start:11802 stop:12299 length:498 start_codon:yes stop_codon:yes gene_type:complete
MKNLVVKPGDVVVSDFGLYQHWSLVTDKLCEQGYPMLISATKRNGTVQEEKWIDVTQGKHTYVTNVSFDRPLSDVLFDARNQIGLWIYSITTNNCEHFVKKVTGLKVTSNQVVGGVAGAAIGATLVATLSENPKAIKILGVAALLAALVVLTVKATEQNESFVEI